MITIVGGTYDELCFEPHWRERYGSGLRACHVLNKLSPGTPVDFYTFCNNTTADFLKRFSYFTSHPTIIQFTATFFYDHPLISPRISPRPDTYDKNNHTMNVDGENILYYGFLEGICNVKGKKVVYDPQSPVMPLAFSKTNSQAEELAYVINFREASILAGSEKVEEIKRFFFNEENAKVLVLKMGPKGALVSTAEGIETIIPVYKTNNVWPIGSGDVFAAVFAFYWFDSGDAVKAAQEASWQTASYSNNRNFSFSAINSNNEFRSLIVHEIPSQQVYLAGPFFTFSERWLIDQIRISLIDMNLNVFSPWHDVGHGIASDVVQKDLDALEKSAIVFAVLDGLDSGTIFEIGYAVKKGIPIVAYVENESSESIKMLEGTNCILEKDLTTAIYKCFWKLAENG